MEGPSDVFGIKALLEVASGNGVRLRVVGRTKSLADAVRVGNEVEALYTNGPSAGAGVTKSAREVLAVASTLVPRDLVSCRTSVEVV